ncbi:MAG: Omp28-related outer membrane protein [Saprospiraceae bacterium]|nr:Omp28-related outer membrane protein [Saprospiraceae bacterium]
MKEIFYTLSILLLSIPLLDAQVSRKVFVEEATQASCPPCFVQNPPFDALMKDNADKVVVVKYQVWWPGYDPMYEHNPTDVNARIGDKYLQKGLITGAPNVVINGTQGIGTPPNLTQSLIDQRSIQTSPFSVTVDHVLNDATSTVDIEIKVKNETTIDLPGNTYSLYVATTEDEILFDEPPGTNGEKEFLWVFRQFVTGTTGEDFGAVAGGDSLTFSYSAPIPYYTYDLEKVAVVAWVERNQTGQVIQAGHSEHKPLNGYYPELSSSYSFVGYDGYCDSEIDIEFMIQNNGSEEVTSFDISAILEDGSLQPIYNWTGSIAPGAEETVTLSGVGLSPGGNGLRAIINNIDGKLDRFRHNNEINNSVYYVLSENPFATEINEGFVINDIRDLPPNMIIDNPDEVRLYTVNQDVFQAVTWPLGGHGLSDGCMRYDFVAWSPGQSASLVFDKVDLTASKNTSLKFTHAYAARGGANNDRIIIEASTDCAETWETVYDEFGRNIITGADPGTNTRFYPRPNEWADVELDISQFDGEGEVIFRFRGISAGAQAYYLDDIVVQSNPDTRTVDHALAASLRTFPNPASDKVNIHFDLEEGTNTMIEVFDLTGSLVEVIESGEKLTPGSHTYEWYPSNDGVFAISISTDKGQATQRITVVK